MNKNMGRYDSGIRVLLAVIFTVLYFTGTVTGTFGTLLIILGGILLATGFISFCPVYSMLGVNTCDVKNKQP